MISYVLISLFLGNSCVKVVKGLWLNLMSNYDIMCALRFMKGITYGASSI